MYTTAALLDVHERTHRSIQGVLAHLEGLPAEELQREVPHFSYPTLAQQLHHVITAERYWLRVLRGELVLDQDQDEYTTVDALQALRAEVAADTVSYIGSSSDDDVNRIRTVTTYGDRQVDLAPALVVLRTQTHAYQHQGEIASMLRHLGHTFPSGLDFPLVD
ncbi:MAG: DinB family protein [Planctomycetota bacterium]|nr:DinB family protein [Planctomycetota bacterium]